MKKETREILKTIISNQELIMKALNIGVPLKKVEKELPKKSVTKKAPVKKATVQKGGSK